jgi:hypothetical protein
MALQSGGQIDFYQINNEFLSLSQTEFYRKINNKYDRTEVNQDGSPKFKRQFQAILPS